MCDDDEDDDDDDDDHYHECIHMDALLSVSMYVCHPWNNNAKKDTELRLSSLWSYIISTRPNTE